VTDKTTSDRVMLGKRLLRHSNLCAKHESCFRLLLTGSEGADNALYAQLFHSPHLAGFTGARRFS
jgi:hypothetical protein